MEIWRLATCGHGLQHSSFDKLRHKMLKSRSLVVFLAVILRLFPEITIKCDVISGCACIVSIVTEIR